MTPPLVQLVISFDPATNNIHLDGPVNDPRFCNMLLTEAHYMVDRLRRKAEENPPSQIVIARVGGGLS